MDKHPAVVKQRVAQRILVLLFLLLPFEFEFELLFMNKVAKWQYTTGDNEHSRINLKAVKKKKK